LIRPVELWNRTLPDGRELWRVAGAPFVEAGGRAEAIVRAVLGVAPRLPYHRRLRLAGGLTRLPGFRAAVGDAALVDPHGSFAGVEAGLAAFPGAVVVDLGQTAMKLGHRDIRKLSPRPAELPRRFFHEGLPPDPQAVADRVARWLGEELADFPAAPLVLAMPCPLGPDGRLGHCTYGFTGARLPGFQPTHTDVELAALTSPPGTLVVTLGLGPGGALVT
jgi:hypothetical protein